MKYLVYFAPSEDFLIARDSLREIIRKDIISIPSSMPHCTVMCLYVQEEREAEVIQALEDVVVKPFSVNVEELAVFDADNTKYLVARLSRPRELYRLHIDVIQRLSRFFNDRELPKLSGDFSDVQRFVHNRFGSPFYAQFYNPHVTVAEVKCKPDIDRLVGLEWSVSDFCLAKRLPGGWQKLRNYAAARTG